MLDGDEGWDALYVLKEAAIIMLSIAARLFVVLLFFYEAFPERWPF